MSEKGKGYYAKKLAYIKNFNKKTYMCFCLKLNKESEADIIEFMRNKENKQGYIKDLIRDDMSRAD